jgi:glutamate-1-semialdehyde 2,1-aminomutase
VPWGDVAALEQATAAAGDDLAAVILEPVVERLPDAGWIAAARTICDRRGAVLIFDEIKTGFRLRRGGYMEESGVLPDLATFGKAMANGFPLACVVGRAAPMEEGVGRTWISSTLASEAMALAAAEAVLDRHAAEDVCAELAGIGRAMSEGVRAAIATSGYEGATVEGIDPMWFVRFERPHDESRFLARALAHGVMFKRGAYNYVALPHAPLLHDIEAGASKAFVEMVEEDEHGAGEDDA